MKTYMSSHMLLKPFPNKYRILPEDIPLAIPGFRKHFRLKPRVLVPEKTDSDQWFISFANRIANAVALEYLPVCRIADGEYRFLAHEGKTARLPQTEGGRRR